MELHWLALAMKVEEVADALIGRAEPVRPVQVVDVVIYGEVRFPQIHGHGGLVVEPCQRPVAVAPPHIKWSSRQNMVTSGVRRLQREYSAQLDADADLVSKALGTTAYRATLWLANARGKLAR